MAEHPHVQLLRDAYAAFGKGDLAALTPTWAEDIRWHVPGTTDLAGTYEGHEAVLGFLGAAMDRTEGTLRVEPVALFADDTHGVALVHTTARRGDRHLDTMNAHICRFREDRVMEFWEAPTEPQVVDAFWA
jgi:hypothetical protein